MRGPAQSRLQGADANSEQPEAIIQYAVGDRSIIRSVRTRRGLFHSAVDASVACDLNDLSERFDSSWLRAKSWPTAYPAVGSISVADLFCGSGGLSLGAWEAARALQLDFRAALAVDNELDAIDVYRENFAPRNSFCTNIETLVGDEVGASRSDQERLLEKSVDQVDLVLAGPPCQGHSDLNNFTRRQDPRNALIHRVIRFVEIFQPQHVIIENVQGIRHDRSGAFQAACADLRKLGYETMDFLLEAQLIGVPQRRRRCFIVASRTTTPSLKRIMTHHSTAPRSFDWGCADLDAVNSLTVFDTAARVYPENQRRMDFLLAHDLYDLPNEERPDCHKLKDHDYTSVYGRLHANKPAPTITTGFGSPGQGRYTHPRYARTITPHEASRLQFIPDFFCFNLSKRKRLQKLIGNAVPSKLGYAIVLDLLGNE